MWFTAHAPGSAGWTAAHQVRALLDDGAGALQAWAADLDAADSFLCYGNDGLSQGAWAAESGRHDLTAASPILAAQITAFQPDVVLMDASLTDLLAAARSALRPAARLIGFALHRRLVTNADAFDRLLLPETLGLRPPPPLATTATWDVLCRAQVRRDDHTLFGLLAALSKAPLGLLGEFTIAYHLMAETSQDLPVGLAIHDRGPLYGAAFHAAAGSARLILDVEDGASIATRLDRLTALAAAGAAVIAQRGPATDCLRPPIPTFETPEALIQLVYDLLRDSARRESIRWPAARGAPTPADILGALTAG